MIDSLCDELAAAVPITLVPPSAAGGWVESAPDAVRAWARALDFSAQPGKYLAVPSEAGRLAAVIHGSDAGAALWSLGDAAHALPEGIYRLDPETEDRIGESDATALALGWALGAYRFTRYRAAKRKPSQLVWPRAADRAEVERLATGISMARDLINIPAEEMGPADLAAAAHALAAHHPGARLTIVPDTELPGRNYPKLVAVGRGSSRPPCLIDLVWGKEDAPRVTLVGKGVCFDSGGLDIKPAGAMRLMKKDMGGAATVLGLAHAIMDANLPIRLRVLVPAVENAVSGNAFRPLDVFKTRKGLTVEIGNTDAEGRLILADALTEATSESPALLVDFATLTGAARTALGPDLPALFTPDDGLAAELTAAAMDTADPLWRLPLWAPYASMIESKIADLDNSGGDTGMAGAITAALFLQRFVEPGIAWAHIDTYAWNPKPRPGRPEGGEALGLRAVYALIKRRFATS